MAARMNAFCPLRSQFAQPHPTGARMGSDFGKLVAAEMQSEWVVQNF